MYSATLPLTQGLDGRVGQFMQTYTGGIFYPMDPDPEEVHILDIAHSLSMQCRYAGHSLRFYSVAEHCVLLARKAQELQHMKRTVANLLLHDAAEAYLVDVPRPIKPFLVGYPEMERKVDAAIRAHFGLEPDHGLLTKAYDEAILHDEKAQNMAPCSEPWNLRGKPLGVDLQFWPPHLAEDQFMALARELNLRGA
jgi:uncharacterized protein